MVQTIQILRHRHFNMRPDGGFTVSKDGNLPQRSCETKCHVHNLQWGEGVEEENYKYEGLLTKSTLGKVVFV